MARPKSICTIPDCGKDRKAHGYCNGHLRRWQKYGDPLAGQAYKNSVKPWAIRHAKCQSDECLIWPFALTKSGYGIVNLGNGHNMIASRYMCLLAHGEPPTPKHEAAHNCGKGHTGCVNPKHLRWATRLENIDDMIGHGTSVHGSRNPQARLTEFDVREIRSLYRRVGQREMAEQFGVTRGTINAIVRRRSWPHLL
jgi:hypothetical protein